MEPTDLALPTLASLAGTEADRLQLDLLTAHGFPGLRRSHGYVFQRLIDDEPTITALAGALGITQQGASKQVQELESLGYVERREVAGDLRARTVALTTSGRAAIETGRRIQADFEAQVAAKLGPEAVTTAKQALAALLTLTGASDRVRTRTFPSPPS